MSGGAVTPRRSISVLMVPYDMDIRAMAVKTRLLRGYGLTWKTAQTHPIWFELRDFFAGNRLPPAFCTNLCSSPSCPLSCVFGIRSTLWYALYSSNHLIKPVNTYFLHQWNTINISTLPSKTRHDPPHGLRFLQYRCHIQARILPYHWNWHGCCSLSFPRELANNVH